jgi:hypothetical protein
MSAATVSIISAAMPASATPRRHVAPADRVEIAEPDASTALRIFAPDAFEGMSDMTPVQEW